MNIMNMPGFTAKASLYTTTGHYQPIRNASAGAGRRGVIPQQEAKRVGPPIGAPGTKDIELSCAAFNGLVILTTLKGPNGGKCDIYSTLSNCKPRTGGGCTCETTVTAREGDCGD